MAGLYLVVNALQVVDFWGLLQPTGILLINKEAKVTNDLFLIWLKRLQLSVSQAAAELEMPEEEIAGYALDAPIPRVVALACSALAAGHKGYEGPRTL